MTEIPEGGDKISTKARILDAAEKLFSEKGFAETSMREITNEADVNLASVNYHFGSKDELINAVFLRAAEPLFVALKQNLENLKQSGQQMSATTLETSLRVLVKSVLQRAREMKGGSGIFMRLLSRAYSDPETKVRDYLAAKYAPTMLEYVKLLTTTVLPGVSAEQIYWRSYYMVGSLAFVMSSEGVLRLIAKKDYNFDTTDQNMIEYLVQFLAAGFRAA